MTDLTPDFVKQLDDKGDGDAQAYSLQNPSGDDEAALAVRLICQIKTILHVSEIERQVRSATEMGVIRRNANRSGTEAGTKYHCDKCSIDISATVSSQASLSNPHSNHIQVRISCAEPTCHELDLCVPCFSRGETAKNHDPRTHRYHVVEQNSIPIYTEDWGADEELLLLEGAERYGFGSWADIAEHIGGYRDKDEVRDHYIDTYVNSVYFPLPELRDPKDKRLFERVPKDEFQARKKRRIEERKEAAKAAPPATPKQKPTASVPACHEVQGFMPGRLEFETEHFNEAEEAVQHMQFEPGDGLDPITGVMDEETHLKMIIFDIYNARLTSRADRKRIIFEHNLLDYKKNALLDKKRTKEERDLLQKAKPFATMMNHDDHEKFSRDLLEEHNLRLAIHQLQDWKHMGIADLKHGEKYETDKAARLARMQPQGAFDRLASVQKKANQQQASEMPSDASKMTAPELPLRFQKPKTGLQFTDSKPTVMNDFDKMFAEGSGALTPPAPKAKDRYIVPPLSGITPYKLEDDKTAAADLQLLSKEEIQLCNALRMRPKPYLALKDGLLREAMKQGGQMKKKEARNVCRVSCQRMLQVLFQWTDRYRLMSTKPTGFSTFSYTAVGLAKRSDSDDGRDARLFNCNTRSAGPATTSACATIHPFASLDCLMAEWFRQAYNSILQQQ